MSSPPGELIPCQEPIAPLNSEEQQVQSLNFPISFPAYVYKVADTTAAPERWRYGILDQDLAQLRADFGELKEVAVEVVKELLQLRSLPDTEDLPDSLCDLNDEEWAELNRLINAETNHKHQALGSWPGRL